MNHETGKELEICEYKLRKRKSGGEKKWHESKDLREG